MVLHNLLLQLLHDGLMLHYGICFLGPQQKLKYFYVNIVLY